jgi:O-antigen/teichoic acid export membrane protein
VGQQSLSRFFVVVFSGKFLALLLTLLTPMVLTRLFTKEEYGLYYQLFTAAMLFELAFVTGLRPSIYFFSPNERSKHHLFCFNAIFVNLLIGAFVLGLTFLFKEALASQLRIEMLVDYLPWMVIYTTFHLISTLLPAHYIVSDDGAMAAKTEIWFATLRTLLLVLAAFYVRTPESLLQALILWSVAKLAVSVYVLIPAPRHQLRFAWREYRFYLLKQLRYALPLGFGSIFQMFILRLDRVLVTAWYGASGVASYAVGFFRIPLIGMFFTSLSEVMVPRLAVEFKEGRLDEARRIWLSAIEKSVLLLVPMGLYFFVFGEEFIVTLFTSKYLDAVPVFQLCSLLAISQSIAYGAVIRASGQTRFILLANALSLVSFVLGLYFFSSAWGITGVAAAVVASQFTQAFAIVFLSLEVLESSYSSFPWFRILAVLGLSVASTFALRFGLLQLVPLGTTYSSAFLPSWVLALELDQMIRLSLGLVSIPVNVVLAVWFGLIPVQVKELLKSLSGKDA